VKRPDELIRLLADTCERLKLDYFITGSVASMYYGEPRFTNDVDIVVEIPSWKVDEFCRSFPPPDFYVDPVAAMAAATGGSHFNIVQIGPGMKADVNCYRDTPFESSRLSRRRIVQLAPDVRAYIASPEDTIIKKLEFYKAGGSDKHLRDIASILRAQRVTIDRPYIEHWALRQGVTAEWRAVADKAGPLP